MFKKYAPKNINQLHVLLGIAPKIQKKLFTNIEVNKYKFLHIEKDLNKFSLSPKWHIQEFGLDGPEMTFQNLRQAKTKDRAKCFSWLRKSNYQNIRALLIDRLKYKGKKAI